MHCTTYQRYTNTIGWLGRSKRNHREVTYSIVQDVGKVSVAVLDDEGGESKSARLDAAVERVVARSYALHRPASFCTVVRCAAVLWCLQ